MLIRFKNYRHRSRFSNLWSHSVMTGNSVGTLLRRTGQRCSLCAFATVTMTGVAARIETGLADQLPTLLEYRAFAGEMAERLKARAC